MDCVNVLKTELDTEPVRHLNHWFNWEPDDKWISEVLKSNNVTNENQLNQPQLNSSSTVLQCKWDQTNQWTDLFWVQPVESSDSVFKTLVCIKLSLKDMSLLDAVRPWMLQSLACLLMPTSLY
jgi:hypothetical protein